MAIFGVTVLNFSASRGGQLQEDAKAEVHNGRGSSGISERVSVIPDYRLLAIINICDHFQSPFTNAFNAVRNFFHKE